MCRPIHSLGCHNYRGSLPSHSPCTQKAPQTLVRHVYKFQNGLRELATEFCPGGKNKKKSRGTESKVEVSTPNPRVKLFYIYLMAWFVMHCPNLMTLSPKDSSGGSFIQRHKRCDWRNHYIRPICMTVCSHQNYHIYYYFHDFSKGVYNEEF